MPPKNNDVLEEQIKMLFRMLEENKKDYMGIFVRIEKMLADIKTDSVTKEQMDSALKLHEANSVSRHNDVERDVTMMKKTLGKVVTTLVTTIIGIISSVVAAVIIQYFNK